MKQLLSYLATLEELRVSCPARRRRPIFGAKLVAWRHKIFHISHFFYNLIKHVEFCLCMSYLITPRVIGSSQRSHRDPDLSPKYGHVLLVNEYLVETAVN